MVDSLHSSFAVGMSLHDVYTEWKEGILENGKRGMSLEYIEKLRLREHVHLRNPKDMGLKSAVQKRRCLIRFIEEEAAKEPMGCHRDAINKAIAKVNSEMDSLYGLGWTLNHMYKHINGYFKKSKK